MAQCAGRSQRTGERCRRAAAGGATVCHYHGQSSGQAEDASRRVAARDATSRSVRPAFTTKVLSSRTWDDFEKLFAVGTGWGRCTCLFALDARRSTRGGTWAEQRQVNLGTMRGLVEENRSQGVLVYDRGEPVGWCQFVPKDQLRFGDERASRADWFITCFVIEPLYRGVGATGVALRAAVKAISRRGGGVVEGWATAMASDPPPKSGSRDVYVEDDVLFLGGSARVRYGFEVEGVGPVAALYRSRRSMHGAPLGGTVELFRREGFEAVGVLPRPKSALADRIVMRRTVGVDRESR
jgi:hypothetical protein